MRYCLSVLLSLAVSASAASAPEVPAEEPRPVSYLFVQTGDKALLTPKPGADGVYKVVIKNASNRTVYFSDRPKRDAGSSDNAAFLKNLGFDKVPAPNAAIVGIAPDGKETVAVVALTAPVWDPKTSELSYEAKVLPKNDKSGLAVFHGRSKSASLPAELKDPSLFIDDCGEQVTYCGCKMPDGSVLTVNSVKAYAACYSWGACQPCRGLNCYYICSSRGGVANSACLDANAGNNSSCIYRCHKDGSCDNWGP